MFFNEQQQDIRARITALSEKVRLFKIKINRIEEIDRLLHGRSNEGLLIIKGSMGVSEMTLNLVIQNRIFINQMFLNQIETTINTLSEVAESLSTDQTSKRIGMD